MDKLTAIGVRLRAQYLLQQAGYTLGIANADGAPLAAVLAPGFLDLVAKVRDDVARALDDKSVLAAESKLATGTQNMTARQVKLWGRRAVARVKGALRAGARVPEEMTRPTSARTVPALLGQANKLLSLLVEHKATLDAVGAPTQPLIDEGRRLCDALTAADSTQEQTRSSALPAAVEAFQVKKGELYTGIKIINDAGHEVYAHDPSASGRYNLSILYRRYVPGAAEPQPASPAPSPTAG
jgi:hypothetical protein